PDPPDRTGDELDVARGIESPRGLDEPEVPLVNQIEKGHAESAVALRVADDEPEIAFDQARKRGVVSLALDALAEIALLVGGEARQLGDLPQVRRERARVALHQRVPAGHA